jgi:hypothetical protein
MIFDASRVRPGGARSRAYFVAPRMRGASTWRLTRRRAPTRPFPVQRAARWTPAATAALAAAAALGLAIGAVVQYFLDRGAGRRRRHTARDRVLSRARRGERAATVRARRAESRAVGVVRHTVKGRRRGKEPLDDVTLTHRVESELYRRARVPKGHISVNAEDGVVFLRGVMDRQDQIERMEAVTRGIRGVGAVENLLHTPGTRPPASRPKLVRERNGM